MSKSSRAVEEVHQRGVRARLLFALPLALAAVACGDDGGGESTEHIHTGRKDGGVDAGTADAAADDAGGDDASALDGGTGDASEGEGGDSGASGPVAPPSNVPSGAIDPSGVGDVVIAADCVLNTTTGTFQSCSGGSQVTAFQFVSIEQAGSAGAQAALFVMKSLRIAQGGKLHVVGTVPAILYAQSTIQIDGTIDGFHNLLDPAGAGSPESSGRGGGLGGGEARVSYNSGGGGSYCGLGGKGGAASNPDDPAGPGTAYGAPELEPLLAGSSGGGEGGMYPTGGLGGPAIQLAAGTSLTVSITGGINAGGRGGSNTGGAGGSGGALLLEAPSVIVRGRVSANGGAGALNNGGSDGQTGQLGDVRAEGAGPTAGQGSGAGDVNGTDGSFTAGNVNSSGGGGGGAGRIRINTSSGAADVTGATFSPALTTPCATQGTL